MRRQLPLKGSLYLQFPRRGVAPGTHGCTGVHWGGSQGRSRELAFPMVSAGRVS
jgi:hypothetical protein